MSHIFIGIYDEDAVYGKRLMEYINRQKEYPLTAAAFASLEALTEFIASQDVKGVILEEGTQINSKVPVYYLKKEPLKGACRYGSAKEIVKEAYAVFSPKGLESGGVTGVYSPSDNLRRTGFALETAVKRSALYLGMEAYGYGVQNRSMEDLLFAVKARRENIIDYAQSLISGTDGVKRIGSARCFMDYKDMSGEDYRWFFQRLEEAGISSVLDMSTACIYDFELFSLCDRLYLPIWEEDMEDPRLLGFKELSKQHPVLSKLHWKEVYLSETQNQADRTKCSAERN